MRNLIFSILFIFLFLSITKKAASQNFVLINDCEIITDLGYSEGCAWGDYDNDGLLDLFVTNSWTNDNNLLYKNIGNNEFEKIIDGIIVNDGGNSNGCTWGDYNNDGLLDLFVANVNNQHNYLYKNIGNGNFLKDTNSILYTDTAWSYGCSWADYDNDGFLDLFVSNYHYQQNFLYHNNQNGSFEKITTGLIVEEKYRSQNAIWSDLNNDGFPDLLILNDEQNSLFANNKNGTFSKINKGDLVKDLDVSFGASISDYNNDGLLDIFVANWAANNCLYKNLGNYRFKKITDGEIVSEYCNTEGSTWGDYDNDGDKDLFITNDGVNFLYINEGKDVFTKIDNLNINTDGDNSNGCTFTDFNNDGFLDLFIANGGNQTNLMYLSTGNSNNWVKIKCIGVNSNLSAIGTKIEINSKINGKTVSQYYEISAQSGGGYGSQTGAVAHFGLSDANIVDKITIKWANGNIQYLYNVSANNFITITENKIYSDDYRVKIYPNPFIDIVSFDFNVFYDSVVDLKIFDFNGNLIKHCINNKKYEEGNYTCRFNNETTNKGVYFYQFTINEKKITGKIINM